MIVVNSFIWQLVLALIGIISVVILLAIISCPVMMIFKQYKKHSWKRRLNIAESNFEKATRDQKEDGDDNGTQKNK